MLQDKTIGVVIPAYNEEKLIGRVIETMPDFVDAIIIVDDCSRDRTAKIVESYKPRFKDRLKLVQLKENLGAGGAVREGYKRALEMGVDVIATMNGDAQMDPDDLIHICMPVVEERADYSKGNRLFTGEAWKIIPRVRYLGNSVLSLLTKIASGYWHIADSQTGYTAISQKKLKELPLEKLYGNYGYPNHMLVLLNVAEARVCDVPIKPIYNVGEASGIRIRKVIPKISWLLFKCFFYRLIQKYIIRDFHPLVFFYLFGFALLFLSLPLGFRMVYYWIIDGRIPSINALTFFFSVAIGWQSVFFGMWMDMDTNKYLKIKKIQDRSY